MNEAKNGIGKTKITPIDKIYDWGLYIWQLPDGHLFRNEDNDLLSIQAYKGDLAAISELRKAAAYYGQPEGKPWFYSGGRQVSDSEYSEQVDRMSQGLIPSMNDLGAVYDAQQSIKEFGNE